MADSEKLVLNHVLCFLFSRLHRCEVRQLKVALLNFYCSEDINLAKDVLVNCAKTLQTEDNTARMPRRRDSESRAAREVDDIFSLIADLDANKLLRDLPKFVSDSPDKMPSVNLVEGDLNAVMQRLDKIDYQLHRLETSVNKSAVSAASAAAITQHVMHVSTGRGAINNPMNMNEHTVNEHTVATSLANINNNINNHDISASAAASVSHVSSHECASCSEVSDVEEGRWHEAKRRKRRRTPSTPHNNESSTPVRVNQNNTYANVASKPSNKEQPHPHPHQRQSKRIPTVYGRSRNVNIGDTNGAGQIFAAKPYVGKATFCVDNVSLTATIETMASYVAAMDIDVLGCYEVNPRRTLWQRQNDIYPNDRKTFRICIPKEDSKHFLDPRMWPAHIAVSQWRFKKKQGESKENEAMDPVLHDASRPAHSNSAPLDSNTSNSAATSGSVGPWDARSGTQQQQQRATAPAAGSALSDEGLQSTLNRFTVLSSDCEPADMDATILVSNNGDAVK
jgi:hypothetical protein